MLTESLIPTECESLSQWSKNMEWWNDSEHYGSDYSNLPLPLRKDLRLAWTISALREIKEGIEGAEHANPIQIRVIF